MPGSSGYPQDQGTEDEATKAGMHRHPGYSSSDCSHVVNITATAMPHTPPQLGHHRHMTRRSPFDQSLHDRGTGLGSRWLGCSGPDLTMAPILYCLNSSWPACSSTIRQSRSLHIASLFGAQLQGCWWPIAVPSSSWHRLRLPRAHTPTASCADSVLFGCRRAPEFPAASCAGMIAQIWHPTHLGTACGCIIASTPAATHPDGSGSSAGTQEGGVRFAQVAHPTAPCLR